MELKDNTILILGVVAVIAIPLLVLFFQSAITGGGYIQSNYPQTIYIKSVPEAVQAFPKAVPDDPMLTYASSLLCDEQARLGTVPKGYTWEAVTAKQRQQRENGNKLICLDAPRQIAQEVVACCQPPVLQ